MSARTGITVVTDRGQVSIPAELRKQLALTKGQHLLWERVSDRELRVIILEAKQAVGAHAMRGFARRFRNRARTTDDWMRELREGED